MIYLNGPPGSGKTALADALCNAIPGVTQVQFPTPLWEIADTMLYSSGKLFAFDPPPDYSQQKIKSSTFGEGHTWRDFFIEQATLLRKYFGPDILSQICAKTSNELFLSGIDTIIYPNTRLDADLAALIPLVPRREQVLLRLERNGATWCGDLGGYIFPEGIASHTFTNNTTIQELLDSVLVFLEEPPHVSE
jgi:hypothetical protein